MINKTQIVKDLNAKTLVITRSFDGPLVNVWKAWTESELLDQWWAPRPWMAKTKSMNFEEGGFWHYSMVGPDGTEVWARIDFNSISDLDNFKSTDSFCDEQGTKNHDFPIIEWTNTFRAIQDQTRVDIVMTFNHVSDIEKIIEMGFETGFSMAHENLDELLLNTTIR